MIRSRDQLSPSTPRGQVRGTLAVALGDRLAQAHGRRRGCGARVGTQQPRPRA